MKVPDLDHTLTVVCRALENGAAETVTGLLAILLDASPVDPNVFFAIGLAWGVGNNPRRASGMFAQALEVAPEYHDARFNLAKSLKDQGENSRAEREYRHYLLDRPDDVMALYNLANIVALGDRSDEAVGLFRKVLAAAPHFHNCRTNLALIEEQRGNATTALGLLDEVLAAEPDHAHAIHLRRSILSKTVPHWHFTMLNDHARNDAYEQAIAAAVRGRHVLEIGAGSGLLAMMAARHGAASVVACETSAPLAAAAHKIVARNGLADRVRIVAKKSMQLAIGRDLAQRADVLIAEIFDVGLLGEGFVPALVHARAELLVDAPRLIPARARIHAVLIACPELKNIHPIGRVSGFDLSDFNDFLKTGYEAVDMTGISYERLTEPVVVADLDFATLGLETVETDLELTTIRTGACHAVAFWFDLDFGDGSTLSSYPDKPTSHWKQAVQFFGSDKHVLAGDVIRVRAVRSSNRYSFSLA